MHVLNASWMSLHLAKKLWRLVQQLQSLRRDFVEFLQQLEKKLGKNYFFWHIPLNVSATTEPIFTKLSALVVRYVRMIKLALVLQSLKGLCYGNQLILGPFCSHQYWNKMQHCSANACIIIGTNAFTWCKNVVKSGSVTSVFKNRLCGNYFRKWAAVWRSSLIWHLGIPKRIGISQFWY